MLSLLSWQNELLTIQLNPDAVTFIWLQPCTTNNSGTYGKQFLLKAYQHSILQHHELANGKLCNPTWLAQHITVFIRQHNLKNPYIAVSIAGESITDTFVTHHSASPTLQELIKPDKTISWHYLYAYPNPSHSFTFYICGIAYAVLFQYVIFAHIHTFNLILCTTQSMSLLKLYHYLQGSAFTHSALSTAMIKHNNNIQEVVNSCFPLTHILHTDHLDIEIDTHKHHIYNALGLVISSNVYRL